MQGLNTGTPGAAVMEDKLNAKKQQKNHAFICDKFYVNHSESVLASKR